MIYRILPIIALWLLIDLYIFQAVKTAVIGMEPTAAMALRWTYWLLELLIFGVLGYATAVYRRQVNPSRLTGIVFGLIVLSFVPKLLAAPFLLVEDVTRLFAAGVNWFTAHTGAHESAGLFTGRHALVSRLALGVAILPFGGILYGLTRGRHNYKVHRVTLEYKDLPEAFDGFTITQLSDIHAGSFTSKAEVEKGVALANAQQSDILVFTGDLVNNKADEMEPWTEVFAQLQAPAGKYSILGNHDYGDYVQWESPEAKRNNLARLKQVHAEMGFRLLLNEHIDLEKDGQHLSLLGVENWGKRGFAQYGDLEKALQGVPADGFKVLLSHDPSHWQAETLLHDKHIHLTLAGHTHGMQFGLEIPGFRWSPVQYVYKQWAGIYTEQEKSLYVNRGFGYIGLPGRVGIHPEITVITLKKK